MRMKFYLTVLLAVVGLTAAAQADVALRRRNFNIQSDIALRDWDPVSYFKGHPGKGDIKINYVYKGIKYLFKNQANREEFIKSPGKYEPAYGGWCAYSMAQGGGKQVDPDPATYKIINGKVYLFSNRNGQNLQRPWNADEARLKAAADKNWGHKMN